MTAREAAVEIANEVWSKILLSISSSVAAKMPSAIVYLKGVEIGFLPRFTRRLTALGYDVTSSTEDDERKLVISWAAELTREANAQDP